MALSSGKVGTFLRRTIQHLTMSDGSVVLLGDYDYDYPREKNIRRGLEDQNITVLDCQFSDKEQFIGPTKLFLLPIYYFRIWREMTTILDDTDPDAIFVSRFNPLVLPIAWFFCHRSDCPLIYDLFVSLYRTAEMREVNPVFVWMLRAIEHVTLRIPDILAVETDQFCDLYAEMYSLPRSRFLRLPMGADEEHYYPVEDAEERSPTTVLYWGNFLPHHGVETIVKAAARIDPEEVEFVFLGDGPRRESAESLAAELNLENISFEGFVSQSEVRYWASVSRVTLGVFSNDRRALASITNKVNEGIAMRCAVITERSPAITEWFTHRGSIYMVPPADPDALSYAICECLDDRELVEDIATGGYQVYQEELSPERVGEILAKRLRIGKFKQS